MINAIVTLADGRQHTYEALDDVLDLHDTGSLALIAKRGTVVWPKGQWIKLETWDDKTHPSQRLYPRFAE